jgi:eukaryotic-like serine/threonine-protein kinase
MFEIPLGHRVSAAERGDLMQLQLIAGRYQVLRAIGRGGMGIVWLCRDEVLGREVAVKQIGALPGESATQTKRAMREARSAAALNHPNAVAVYDVVEHDGRPWLVMEYVEGQTLADEISRDGQLSPQRVADIGAQLASALARAHERRIVHRDVKPGNVLIDKAGRPKISDFGIARGHDDEQLTQTGFVTGTPGYLSPELARGGDPASASDVWALGATLYAAVEGQSPYEPRGNPIALLRAIATERPRPMTNAGALGPAIDAMMHEDPARRWDMATSAQRLGGIARSHAIAIIPRVDPAAAEVIAARRVESTQLLEPVTLDAATAAIGRAEPVTPDAATAAIGRAEPVTPDAATAAIGRAEPVTPDAEAAGRPELAGPRHVHGGAPPPPDDRRSSRGWLPLAFVALLVAALGVAYLSSQLGDQGGTTAVRSTTSASKTSKPPSTSSSASSTTSTTSRAHSSSTTAAPPPDADKKLANFVNSYYSVVTKDTNRTWGQLAPKMQNAAGGRVGYDSFWKTIERVKVNQTRAQASAKKAVVNLTYTRDDGTTSTETHQFTFVTHGGAYLIESEQNLG